MGYRINKRELVSRLSNSYAMYRGKPIFCFTKTHDQMYGYILGDPTHIFDIDLGDPTFSAAELQTGYCRDKFKNLGFLIPHIHTGSLGSQTFGMPWCSSASYLAPNSKSIELYNCVMNIHPKFNECLDEMKTGSVYATAFDRNFALVRADGYRELDVHYKGKQIGHYCLDKGKFVLRNSPISTLLKRQLTRLCKET